MKFLGGMRNLKRWVNSKTVPKANGKTDKFPVSPYTGQVCDAHDPANQASYEEAVATGLPVGFVFNEADRYFFIDIDDCLVDGQWTPLAIKLCQMFAGCAIEISQSGTGLHIFGRIPETLPHGCKNQAEGLEYYTADRFAAVTGTGAMGSADHVPPVEVSRSLVATYFPPSMAAAPSDWTTGPCPEWDGPTDDAELIERMLKFKSAQGMLGYKATFKQLWEADEEALGRAYPDTAGDQGRAFDNSSADAALVAHLAFGTGKDCERMDRLVRQSALYRDKWEREDYARRTITQAVAQCQNVYKQRGSPDAPVEDVRVGFQYFTVQNQQELFEGCCYVRDLHRIFIPEGKLLKPEQFRAHFGGRVYALDAINSKTTRNAWEVFTESQAWTFPRVASTCFRPELPPGATIEHEGSRLVNTYVPVATARAEGDVGPFLGLMARLLPAESDRDILLAYMAACVQHIGIKFQWAPLLQGVQGNGKSFIGDCLTKCVGERYTHLPDPKDINNVFNSWLCGNLLILIDEVYTRDRTDTIETLKWMVTNRRVPVQAKGQDQVTGDNRANFFMCSNHKDAILKTQSDRRFCVFFTAQQEFADLARDGLDGDYFPDLYDWARAGGYAIVNGYLRGYKIPDILNPGTHCHRAPATTSTNEALEWSMGGIEQEIVEATESGVAGFNGGWISSMAFDKFMEIRRTRIPLNKRREILKGLGYIPHPALRNGRVNNIIPFENGKPRLYIRVGHTAQNITNAAAAARVYQEAQGYIVAEGAY
jgi:hypothetical protein